MRDYLTLKLFDSGYKSGGGKEQGEATVRLQRKKEEAVRLQRRAKKRKHSHEAEGQK